MGMSLASPVVGPPRPTGLQRLHKPTVDEDKGT